MPISQKRSLSVLVVEDDPEVSQILRSVLSEIYTVECVDAASAALSRLQPGSPDLILLDCFLPGGGFANVLETAKSCRCPVVLMSSLPEILSELAAFGYFCLQKPFRIAELFEAIQATCSRRLASSQ